MSLRLLLAFLAGGAGLWAVARWRRGLQAALVLLVLEGALRKWVFPGAQDLVYFAKDGLLLGVYLGFLREAPSLRRRLPIAPPLAAALGMAVALGVVQIFNPRLPNPLVGILGFKAYFLYVPLLWVVPAAFEDDRQLARFLRRYALLSIPVGLLAAAQFFSPPTSLLNTYARSAGGSSHAVTFGIVQKVRVTGTFSFITGYSSYLLTIAILVLAILAATRWRWRGNVTTYIALTLVLLGMMMSGSRGPVVLLAFLLPLYWWLGVVREREGALTAGRILLGASLIAVVLNYVGSDAVEAFYMRASRATDLPSRLTGPLLSPFRVMGHAGLFGFGIGATHQTAIAVTQGVPYSWLQGVLLEDEPGRIMIELGPLGFALIYFVRAYLALLALRQVFVLRTPFHRAAATSCVLFFLAHLPGGVVFNVTADVYYWFFAGLLLAVMRLDRQTVPVAVRDARPAARNARWAEPSVGTS